MREAAGTQSDVIAVILNPAYIDFLSRVIESCGHIGLVSTLDPVRGGVLIRVTPDTYAEVMDVLTHFPLPLTFSGLTDLT